MVGSVCNPLAEIRKEKGIVYYKLRILSSRKTANQTWDNSIMWAYSISIDQIRLGTAALLRLPFFCESDPGCSLFLQLHNYLLLPSPLQDLHEQVKMLEVLSQASCCSSYIPDLSDFTVQAPEEPKTLLMYALGECQTAVCVAVPNITSYSGTFLKILQSETDFFMT